MYFAKMEESELGLTGATDTISPKQSCEYD